MLQVERDIATQMGVKGVKVTCPGVIPAWKDGSRFLCVAKLTVGSFSESVDEEVTEVSQSGGGEITWRKV